MSGDPRNVTGQADRHSRWLSGRSIGPPLSSGPIFLVFSVLTHGSWSNLGELLLCDGVPIVAPRSIFCTLLLQPREVTPPQWHCMEAASYANLVGLLGSGWERGAFSSEEAQGRHVCSWEKNLTTEQGCVWRNEGGSWQKGILSGLGGGEGLYP